MLWRRATQKHTPRPAAPVPSGESVRLAALQAAWRRDRWVARRRLWLRWTLWGAQCYGVPALGSVGVLAGLWFAVKASMGWPELPSPKEPAAAIAEQTAPVIAPTTPSTSNNAPAAMPPYKISNAVGMEMKFEPSLAVTKRSDSPVSSKALQSADEMPIPPLISENWLHSKEP